MNWRSLTAQTMDECRNAFGEPVVYTPKGLASVSIQGIVDMEFEQVDPNTGAIVSSNQPMLGVRDSDLPVAPQKGDLVLMRGLNYQVIERQQDGQAGTRLLLNRV